MRVKVEILRGKIDDMRMQEGEIILQYCGQIKEEVNASRGAGGHITDAIVISKVLRTLLPIYAIKVSAIQELSCTLGNDLMLDSLIGRLTTFELSNFYNYFTTNVESTFKAQLTLDGS